jgi:ribosomal-protein-alanine acetyltransferase
MVLRIAPAKPQDLDALMALEEAAFPGDRMSRRALSRNIASPSLGFLVAREAGQLKGHALIAFRKGSALARLYSLAVQPNAMGRGLGGKLLGAAERFARNRGADRLRLEVRADNQAAIRLYTRSGYVRLAQIDDYYEDGKAALRYEKPLP